MEQKCGNCQHWDGKSDPPRGAVGKCLWPMPSLPPSISHHRAGIHESQGTHCPCFVAKPERLCSTCKHEGMWQGVRWCNWMPNQTFLFPMWVDTKAVKMGLDARDCPCHEAKA